MDEAFIDNHGSSVAGQLCGHGGAGWDVSGLLDTSGRAG